MPGIRERIGVHVRLEALRQHHLIDVARGDVFLGRADVFPRSAPACKFGRELQRRPPPRGARSPQVAIQFALEQNLGARELIERLEVVVWRDAGVGDDQDAVLHVIEGQHRIEHHEARGVSPIGARAEIAEHRLEPRRGAVA